NSMLQCNRLYDIKDNTRSKNHQILNKDLQKLLDLCKNFLEKNRAQSCVVLLPMIEPYGEQNPIVSVDGIKRKHVCLPERVRCSGPVISITLVLLSALSRTKGLDF